MKITTRCGSATVAELNAHLIAVGVEAGVIDTGWLRADLRDRAGMPPDAPRLAPAIACAITATGVAPDAVAADRGDGQASVDLELAELGVDLVASLRKGKPGVARQQVEADPASVEMIKWRTGAEGRMSDQTPARLEPSASANPRRRPHVVRLGILSHNAIKIAALSNCCVGDN